MASTSPKGHAFGLDVGGTDIKGVAYSSDGRILAEAHFPSRANEGPPAVVQAIHRMVDALTEVAGFTPVMGIGCAGSVDVQRGIVRTSPNFAGWRDVPLSDLVRRECGILPIIENDANCAVFAEFRVGAGRGLQNIVLLTLGTGIGGGLVLGGRLYRGSTGTAGELGHFTLVKDGVACPCGNQGCFERYASGTALSLLGEGASPAEILRQAMDPNHRYAAIVAKWLDSLAAGMVGVFNALDPDSVILGGGLSQGLAPYLARLQGMVRGRVFPSVASQLKVRLAELGNTSGSIGAALLAASG